MLQLNQVISRNQDLALNLLKAKGLSLAIKREDEIHPEISGNKWRKLKYHMAKAQRDKVKGILTFGGAFSNHIAATAFAARIAGLASIGIIRGERVEPLNQTLAQAETQGMMLYFTSRTQYREDKAGLVSRCDPHTDYHHIPEGAADALGLKGCELILSEKDKNSYDVIACASGTGTTAAGIYRSLSPSQKLRVYPALKGDFARKDIDALLGKASDISHLDICGTYHFGGYAKINAELIDFMRFFYEATGVKTDPIYTAKMLYGLFEDIRKDRFKKGTRILAIHTGGLQGIAGIEARIGEEIYNFRPNN